MTGQDIFKQALALLHDAGASDGGDPGGAAVYRRALPYLNQLAAEWWYRDTSDAYTPLLSLSEPVPLPDRVCRVALPYGLAMLLAGAEGDADRQAVFAAGYDARRAVAAGGTITDGLPRPML